MTDKFTNLKGFNGYSRFFIFTNKLAICRARATTRGT